jgi:hypothetical protein
MGNKNRRTGEKSSSNQAASLSTSASNNTNAAPSSSVTTTKATTYYYKPPKIWTEKKDQHRKDIVISKDGVYHNLMQVTESYPMGLKPILSEDRNYKKDIIKFYNEMNDDRKSEFTEDSKYRDSLILKNQEHTMLNFDH